MTASEEPGSDESRRARPTGDAWKEAQRAVSERNDKARRAGKEERQEAERRVAAYERAEQKRGIVHR